MNISGFLLIKKSLNVQRAAHNVKSFVKFCKKKLATKLKLQLATNKDLKTGPRTTKII